MSLKIYKETYLIVDYSNLDDFIKEETGHEFNCVADQEWSNDTVHTIRVESLDKEDEYTLAQWKHFKDTGKHHYALGAILDGLCSEGKIEAGTYLIKISW